MAAGSSSEGGLCPEGSAPTQPRTAKFVLEPATKVSEVLDGSYEGKGRMAGKVCVVTGGSKAIGKTVVEVLALEGGSVYFCSRGAAEGEGVAKGINDFLGEERAFYTRVDVGSTEEVRAWIGGVVEKEGRVDVVVPNAAAFVFGKLEEMDDARWDKVLHTNIRGYAATIQAALPGLRAAGGGSVVAMLSVSSHISQPSFTPYNTSKHGLLGLVRCIAHDYGPENIRCNAVCPGTILTPITTGHAEKIGLSLDALTEKTIERHFIKRLGTTLDCAQATLFLASDESKFITGSSIMVDGGYTVE